MGDRKMNSALKNSGNTSREFPSGTRVLVVDGNQEILHQLETMLKQWNYEVTKCKQGKEALKLMKSESRFDIILTERCLPDIGEFKFVRALGKITDLPPVVVMSSDGDNNTIKSSLSKYGACYYLVKPIQEEELRNMWMPAFKHRPSGCYEAPRETNKDKKQRMVWTPELKEIFRECYLELDTRGEAHPNNILGCMKEKGVEGLTRDQVASHCQKYKLRRINAAPPKKIQKYKLRRINAAPQHALAAGSISVGPNIGTQNFQNIPSMSHINTSLASCPTQDWDIGLQAVPAYGDYCAAPLSMTASDHPYLPTQQQHALAAGSISVGPNIGTQGWDIGLQAVPAYGDYCAAPLSMTASDHPYLPTQQQHALAAGSISVGPNIGTQNFQNIPSMSHINTSLASCPTQDWDIGLQAVPAYGDYCAAPLSMTASDHPYLPTQQQHALAAGSISVGPNIGTQGWDIGLQAVPAYGDYCAAPLSMTASDHPYLPTQQQHALAAGSISVGPNIGLNEEFPRIGE